MILYYINYVLKKKYSKYLLIIYIEIAGQNNVLLWCKIFKCQ